MVAPSPATCACCGGIRLSKLGEDITETLEVILRQWKVNQHVREKFSCRDCEIIHQPPARFHVTARGWAGPNLLAMILFEKFGQHQPLNRQAERCAKEGVPISLSTLADQVGACCTAVTPIFKRIECHVLASERLHGDDTSVPVLAHGRTGIGRIWVYARNGRPFGDASPPAAIFYYSRDRGGEHPQTHLAAYTGILQADAFSGYGKLYDAGRKPGPITEAACWAKLPKVPRTQHVEWQRRGTVGANSSSLPMRPKCPTQSPRQSASLRCTHGARSRPSHRRAVRHRA